MLPSFLFFIISWRIYLFLFFFQDCIKSCSREVIFVYYFFAIKNCEFEDFFFFKCKCLFRHRLFLDLTLGIIYRNKKSVSCDLTFYIYVMNGVPECYFNEI